VWTWREAKASATTTKEKENQNEKESAVTFKQQNHPYLVEGTKDADASSELNDGC
jgi:hypothetical protein